MSHDSALHNMALIRVISGTMEIVAALLFLRLRRVETALRINAVLGLIGPVIFILVSVFGIVAVAVRISPLKLVVLTAGSLLVLLGTKL